MVKTGVKSVANIGATFLTAKFLLGFLRDSGKGAGRDGNGDLRA
jgi:hypothetical protein